MVRLSCTVWACVRPVMVAAQNVAPCEGDADVQSLVEPWEDHIRSYANGAVRLALLDTIEPATGSLRILVLTPPYRDDGNRHCFVVGWTENQGFVTLDFAGLTPTYDPVTGLAVGVQARFFDEALNFSNIGILDVVINQATGEVRAGFTVTGRE